MLIFLILFLSSSTYIRCVPKAPDSRFSRSEESCLINCVDRFLDASRRSPTHSSTPLPVPSRRLTDFSLWLPYHSVYRLTSTRTTSSWSFNSISCCWSSRLMSTLVMFKPTPSKTCITLFHFFWRLLFAMKNGMPPLRSNDQTLLDSFAFLNNDFAHVWTGYLIRWWEQDCRSRYTFSPSNFNLPDPYRALKMLIRFSVKTSMHYNIENHHLS